MLPTNLIDFIKSIIEEFAPALAVALWNYEENRIDHETKEKEAALLAAQNLNYEKAVKDMYADKSDVDIINDIAGTNITKPK